ncbi:fatty acid desaturase [Sphingomonas ginsenosidivorax]|uniref:Fatty acid desaturase n=1 Tax=Sphingomonas ginsenosidivorax TaxID=862135 RepID=A0A5C6UBP3_9SPHN|nr:fatty acid desaturase [Sphingomonas ginsenosidivorax]TXC70074.1 fatty acid desaturase [Sphingomonas ginsenosidivorax]
MRRTATGTMEWPTIALAALIYGGWLAVTAWHTAIPTPLLVLAGGWLLAWQGSLQHETIHGHPTGIRPIDDAIGFVPLALWLPYRLYRRSHLAHHGAAVITDPRHDPESRYRVPLGRLAAIPARLQATLLGQMLFGPPIAVARFAIGEGARLVREPRRVLRDWTPHLAGVAILFGWLHHVGLGIGTYCACFVYPGMALTMLRSYAEHRADLVSPARAASVERGGMFALLFLNNNLHAAHHERPRLAWYALPAYHRRHRARFAGSGSPIYRGYGDIVRRFAFRPHDAIVHPGFRGVPM